VNLLNVSRELGTDEQCFAFLEKQRWPDGVRCAVCGCNRISRIVRKSKTKNVRKNLYQCLESTCKQQFSVTSGTIFHDSRVPLSKWFMAINLIMDAKKGLSAMQLQRHLGLGSYQTAWHMAHRIREAMLEDSGEKLSGVVEIDETWVGGKYRGPEGRRRGHSNKEIVVGMKQRGGELRFFHVPDVQSSTLGTLVRRNVSRDVEQVMTDEFGAYPKAFIKARIHGSKHKTVNHSKNEFVRGDVTTNGIESAFSLFKRGVVGSFHHISAKHLHRYLSEFEHRFNRRKMTARFNDLVARSGQTSPLPYRKLVG
jgi:transposase-like protein